MAETRKKGFIERWLTNIVRLVIIFIVTCLLFKLAKGIFNFSKKFTLTKTVKNGLLSQGLFGIILGIPLIPIAFILDVVILVFGILLGSFIFFMLFVGFPFILIYIIIKSLSGK